MRKQSISDHYNMVSDISGRVFPSDEMRELQGDQKGLWCHRSEWNPAHPQLKIRPRRDDQSVPVARTEPPELFPTPPTPDEL
jgi:hypothetical protein